MHALLGLAFLGAALKLSRGRSESFGEIPPPPDRPWAIEIWARKTFSPGTRVRWHEKGPWNIGQGGYDMTIVVPQGTVTTVLDVGWTKADFRFPGVMLWPVWPTSKPENVSGSLDLQQLARMFKRGEIEVLDDHWGPLTVPAKKSYKAGWTPKPPRYKGRP